ncbi:MAG: tetratricopeptide repeat protein [Caulobacterales bacterium]
MQRTALLLSLTAAALLAACATTPVAPSAAAPTAAAADFPSPPDGASTFGLFLAGRAALDSGQDGVASDYLARATIAGGGGTYLKERAFTAALLAGDIPRAASFAVDGEDAEPAARRLGVLVRGVESLAEGHAKEAYQLLSGPSVGYPHKVPAILLAPWAAAAAGDMKDATAEAPMSGDGIAQFFGGLDHAMLLERARRYDQAEAAYKALQTAHGDPAGMVSLGYGAFLERRGRWKDALALYDQSLRRNGDDASLVAAHARAMSRKGAPPQVGIRQGAANALVTPAAGELAHKQDDVALAYLRLALRLDPGNEEAWMIVGDILTGSGDEPGARAAYGHAKPGSDRYVDARNKLAVSYQNAGDKDTALAIARETAAANPQSREAAVDLANLLRINERYGESAEVLGKLIAQNAAAQDWRLLYLRAVDYDLADEWALAEKDGQQALALRPNEPELLNFLGYGWVDRGEHLQDALSMLQKAAAARPEAGDIQDSLGWAYFKLGQYDLAVRTLESAATLDAADPDVNNHLGDAYWRAGRKTEAEFQWRRVLSLEPSEKLKAEVEAKLKSGLDPAPPAKVAGS